MYVVDDRFILYKVSEPGSLEITDCYGPTLLDIWQEALQEYVEECRRVIDQEDRAEELRLSGRIDSLAQGEEIGRWKGKARAQ